MDTLQNLMLGFSVALQPQILVYAFAGCIIGTLVGMMPGLGPLAGISLLLPATFGLQPTTAIVLLVPLYLTIVNPPLPGDVPHTNRLVMNTASDAQCCDWTCQALPAIAMAYLGEEIEPTSLGLSMGLYISGSAFGGMAGRVITSVLSDHFSWRLAVGAVGVAGVLAAWETQGQVKFARVEPGAAELSNSRGQCHVRQNTGHRT